MIFANLDIKTGSIKNKFTMFCSESNRPNSISVLLLMSTKGSSTQKRLNNNS